MLNPLLFGAETAKGTTTVWLHDLVAYALAVAEEVKFDEPSTFQEATSGPNAIERTQAMCEEMESLVKNQTWQLVKRPKGRKIVSGL